MSEGELRLQTCIELFEAGKELSRQYERYDGDMDWVEWLRHTLPKTAINGENGVYNIFDPLIAQSSAQAEMRGRIEELEYLLDAQDQEVDLDGRPITEPYHIISGDGERYLIETRLAQLRAQGGEK